MQDTKQEHRELTEERIREIAKEEVERILAEHARASLEMQMGPEAARRLLGIGQ